MPCESFFFKPLHSLNIFGHAGKCPLFDDVQREILKHLIFRHNFAQLKACVHSWKVVSGIKLYSCFVFLFLDSKYLTNPTVDNLLYFEIAKVKAFFANSNTAQRSEFRTYYCTTGRSLSYMKSLDRFQIHKYIQSNSWCLPIAPICDESKF